MDLQERIQRATQIAEELNRDPMLCQEVKHLITDITAFRLTHENAPGMVLTNFHRRERPQFDLQPYR